jgi:hypothetical protein
LECRSKIQNNNKILFIFSFVFCLFLSNFEQPKRSSKVDTHSNVSNKIDIENKFNALSHE